MNKFKRAVALLLCVVMLAATVSVIPIAASEATTDITSADDFYAISNGGKYKLTTDITIESTLPSKDGIVFDGNGHSITLGPDMKQGAFKVLTNSTLKNVTVTAGDAAVRTFTSDAGGGTSPIVGVSENCTLVNVINEVSFSTTQGKSAWVGGIVGNAKGIGSFTDCINKGAITMLSGEYLGGIVGVNYGVIDYVRCQNIGELSGTKGSGRNAVGGIIGLMYNESSECVVSLESCVSSGTINTTPTPTDNNDTYAGAFIAKRDQGILKSCTSCQNNTNVADFGINGFVNYIEIGNFQDFKEKIVNDGGYYVLTADIQLDAGYSKTVTNVTIDGNGHSIILDENTGKGAFAALTGSVLKNVTVKAEGNKSLVLTANSGGTSPVAAVIRDCRLENVTNEVSFTTTSGKAWVGGIVGNAYGTSTLTDCVNKGAITAVTGEYLGGIVGVSFGVIDYINCKNTGALSGTKVEGHANYVGGLIGFVYYNGSETCSVALTTCVSRGTITINDDNNGSLKGGLIASRSNGELRSSQCYNATNVTADFGYNETTANQQFAEIVNAAEFAAVANNGTYRLGADITISERLSAKSGISFDGNGYTITLASGMKTGAFEMLTDSTVKNLTVNAQNNAVLSFDAGGYDNGTGAVVDLLENSTLENITNAVSYTIPYGTSYAGGVVGVVGKDATGGTCNLKNCINTGNITICGGEYLGAIAGVNNGKAYYTDCQNFGNLHCITGTSGFNYIGGLIGFTYSLRSKVYVSNFVNWGGISGDGDMLLHGGIIGQNTAGSVQQLNNCYNFTNIDDFGSNAVIPNNTAAKSISRATDLGQLEENQIYTLTANFSTVGGYTLPKGVVIDGNGHTITLTNASSGLFANATNAAIIDLTVAGSITADENGSGNIGAVIDTVTAPIVLKNVKNTAAVTVSGTGYSSVGGIVGSVDGKTDRVSTITACNNLGAVNATECTSAVVGGILGTANAPVAINSSANRSSVKGATVSGILGRAGSSASSVRLDGCNNYGSCVSSNIPLIMGICAVNDLGDGLTTVSCRDLANDASALAYTLKLKSAPSMCFYVSKPAFDNAVSYTVSAGDYEVITHAETVDINGLECKVFEVAGISPLDFDEEFEFFVYIDRGADIISSKKAYSVKNYCMTQLNDANADAALKRLCVDMLNYGAEAQRAAGETGALMNADLTSAQKELASTNNPTANKSNSYIGQANPAIASWVGVELDPDDGLAPTFKFTAPSGVVGMVAYVTCTSSKGTATVRSFKSVGDGIYSFKLEGLSAVDFKDKVNVRLQNDKGASDTFEFVLSACAKEMIDNKTNEAFASSALKFIHSIERVLLDVGAYDIKKYSAAVWEGNIVYGENAFVRENGKNDSSVAPITLLYPIDEVIAVRSADTKTLYQEGRDYTIDSQGRLIIKTAAEGGRIRILPYYSEDHSKEAYTYPVAGEYSNSLNVNGLYYYWRDPMYRNDPEGGIAKWNISVTYKHSGTSVITTPRDQSGKFAGLMDKLTAGNEIKVTSLGDSITRGCSAPLNHSAGPWGPESPAYNVMFCDYLEAAYGVNVTHNNLAIDGTKAEQALNATGAYANNAPIPKVIADNPDIFILAYGMNDGEKDTKTETGDIQKIVDQVREACPDTYIIVVSTCLLGQQWSTSNGYRRYFGQAFEDAFANYDKVIVANVTAVDIAMQGYDVENEKNHTGRKSYQDLTGSNSNHPNGFMHRIYLQTIIQSAFGDNKFSD